MKRKREIVLLVCIVLQVLFTFIGMMTFVNPYCTALLRPFIFGSFIPPVRSNMSELYYDIKDSLSILVAIFIYIGYSGMIGHIVFRYNLEGYTYFASVNDSMYHMMVLLTTSNFPDIMIPAYK